MLMRRLEPSCSNPCLVTQLIRRHHSNAPEVTAITAISCRTRHQRTHGDYTIQNLSDSGRNGDEQESNFSEFLLRSSKSLKFWGRMRSGDGRQVRHSRALGAISVGMLDPMGAALDALGVAYIGFRPVPVQVAGARIAVVAEDGSEMPIPLGLRAADVLLFFLERPGELVTKSEIMQAVWPDVVVEESNLTVHISAIRRALDDGRNGESCIQNVPRRGYRFTLGVTASGAASDGQNHRGVTQASRERASRPASSTLRWQLDRVGDTRAGSSKTGGCTRRRYGRRPARRRRTIAFVGLETPALLQPVQSAEPHLASIVALPFATQVASQGRGIGRGAHRGRGHQSRPDTWRVCDRAFIGANHGSRATCRYRGSAASFVFATCWKATFAARRKASSSKSN